MNPTFTTLCIVWILLVTSVLAKPPTTSTTTTTTTTTTSTTMMMHGHTFKCTLSGMSIECDVPILEEIFRSVRKRMSLHGTEYFPNQNAKLFLQLLSGDFQPVNNASCLLDLYKPDNSVMFDDALMVYLNNSDGLYYFEFVTPSDIGIYMVSVRCFFIVDYTKDYADSFTLVSGLASGDYMDTWKDDNVFHSVKEKTVAGGYTIEFYYDFDGVQVPTNYTGMGIYWVGRWDSPEEPVYLHLWDYCNNSWSEHLPNEISTNTPMVTQFLSKEEWNISCFLNNTKVRLRFHDHDPSEKVVAGTLDTDFLEVQMYYLSYGQIEDIRGGGEVHVSSPQDIGDEVILRMLEHARILNKRVVNFKNDEYCIDDQTLIHNITYEYCIGNNCRILSDIMPEKCTFGCDFRSNSCIPNPMWRIGVIILIVLFVIFLIYIFRRWWLT